MWILRLVIVSLALSGVNGWKCDKQECGADHKTCRIEVNEDKKGCTIECSTEGNRNDQCQKSGDNVECFCAVEACHKNATTIKQWSNSLPDVRHWLNGKLGNCTSHEKTVKKFSCGLPCTNGKDNSCAVTVEPNGSCRYECSAKDGSSNQCTYHDKTIECLCDKDGCMKDKGLLTNWRVKMENKHGPFIADRLDKCLAHKSLIGKTAFFCNGKSCHEGRNTSCQFDMQNGKECTAACSLKDSVNNCEMLGANHIGCNCFISNCHKFPGAINIWKKHANKLIGGFSGIDDCLYTTGTVSKKKCGNKKCFYKNDKSCELVVPSDAKSCTFECSAKDYVEDKCTKSGCFCKNGNCHQQEGTVTKWRKEQTKPKGLDKCLIKQNVLSTKMCGGNHCFKNKDKSCILAFKPDGKGCDVKCSANAATNQCKKENGIIKCSSETDEFNMNPLLIQSLIDQQAKTPFKTDAQQCLENKKLLKKKTDKCGEERCFFGYDFCELWFDETQCKVGCTTKNGTNSECNKVDGKSEHHCVCKGDGCYMREKIIEQLIVIQKSTKLSEVAHCLIKKGILTTKTCGKTPCFIGFDESCEVEAKMDGSCAVGCSKETSVDKCQVSSNDTAVQCYCKGKKCQKEQKSINLWQKDLDANNAVLTNKLEECLHEQDALDKSIKCGNQQCYKGRDTCKLEGKSDGTCIVKCSTEKVDNSRCKKNGPEYHCLCNTEDCLTSKSTAYHWKTNMSMSSKEGLRMEGCIDKFVTTTIRPLRTVAPETKVEETFEAKALDQAIASFMSSKPKQESSESGFTFKWWYVLMILALLATLGLFGFVAWSAATRKKRCADYWKKREEEEKKKKKDLAAAKKPVIPSKDAEMEVLPETDIIRKGPHHLQKKFKGETTAHLADNQKSESIHEKLEFVPQLNEEVQIGSDIEVIDGMEQTSVEDTVSVSRMDNFNTVRQASSMSTLVT